MTGCREIVPLLADVADCTAPPADAVVVGRHLHECTRCRSALARERRLNAAIAGLSETGIGDVFTAGVMARLPAAPRKRKRDRRGLRLALLGGLLLLGAATLGTAPESWSTGFVAARPAALPDVVDPAAQALVVLAQTLLLALQTLTVAPVLSSVFETGPTAIGIGGAAAAVALAVFGTCLLALLAGVLARGDRPPVAA